MKSSTLRSALLLAVGVLLLTTPVYSQVNWWRTDGNSAITLELHKMSVNTHGYDSPFGFLHGTAFIGGQFRISPGLSLLTELPIARFDVKQPSYYEDYLVIDDETTIGNPFLGIEFARPGTSSLVRLGIRAPLASEDNTFALAYGMISAPDRMEAFFPKVWTVSALGGMRVESRQQGIVANFLIGPQFMVPTEGDAELFADYSGFVGVASYHARAGISLHGRAIVSEHNIDFGDRFQHVAGLMAGLRFGNIEPGIHVKMALDDDIRDAVRYTYGINLQVNMPTLGERESEF